MEHEDPEITITEAEESDTSYISSSTTIAKNLTSPSSHLEPTTKFPLSQSPLSPAIMSTSNSKIPGFNPFSNLTIPKKGTFHKWKANIVTALNTAQLGPFVLTDQPLPTDPSKQEEYILKDYQALSIIQKTVDSKHFQLVANAQNTWSAFLSILAQYDNSGGLSTAMIFSDIVSLKLDDGGNLSEHLHCF